MMIMVEEYMNDHCFNFINPTMEENSIEESWKKNQMKSILILV
jgi:hypothetical protein